MFDVWKVTRQMKWDPEVKFAEEKPPFPGSPSVPSGRRVEALIGGAWRLHSLKGHLRLETPRTADLSNAVKGIDSTADSSSFSPLILNCYVFCCGSFRFLLWFCEPWRARKGLPWFGSRGILCCEERSDLRGEQPMNLQRGTAGKWRAYLGAFLFLSSEKGGEADPIPSVRMNRYVVFLTEARNI